jgi:putative glutamine amidotransferase
MTKPMVLLPSDVRQVGIHPFHCVGEKYINAVLDGSDAIPILMPSWGAGVDLVQHDDSPIEDLLDRVDGVFLTGSPSNVHPVRYGVEKDPDYMLDEQRDEAVFELIQACLKRNMPLLVVCRGFQELNVALGGTLYDKVHEVKSCFDHRENTELDRNGQYAPAHEVVVQTGGILEEIIGAGPMSVNSLHGQGVREVASGVHVEAISTDGLVEGVSLPGRDVLGVQWHPEWRFQEKPEYAAVFKWFGDAVRRYAASGSEQQVIERRVNS